MILSQLDNNILTLTISRPTTLNAFDGSTCKALGDALDKAKHNDAVRVVIVTGDGNKAFSAGFDLQFAEQNPAVYQQPLFASEIVRRPLGDKPIIAAVNGIAFGLGFELALACDLIIAAKHAKFALPEPMVGLAALGGGVVRLIRTIGSKQALGICLTGRHVSAKEALQLGFINEIAEDDVLNTANDWAKKIAIGGPLSIKATQEIAARCTDIPLEQALDPHSYPSAIHLLASEDAHEGRQAFLERRSPQWKNQ